MSKQPKLIVGNERKKKGTYSPPSHWRDGPKYQAKPKKPHIWAATFVLTAVLAIPFVTPMIIPAVAFIGQTVKRQQLYVVDGDTIHYNGEKIRIANIDAPEIGKAKCDSKLKRGLEAKAQSP